MKRKSTFKVSSRRRPVHQRMTPVAWAMVGVTTLAVGLAATLGVMSLTSCSSGDVWQPTPTATPVPTGTPVPTSGPSATPTVWYEGMVSPTPESTAMSEPSHVAPAWWSEEMRQDEEGHCWPPDDVIEMVKEHYFTNFEEQRALIPDGAPADLDGIELILHDWYSGERLEVSLGFLEGQREGASIYTTVWDGPCLSEVQDWSADGMECTIGVSCQDGTLTERDPLTGEILSQTHLDYGGLLRVRMRYDPDNGHWKQHQLIDFTPIGN